MSADVWDHPRACGEQDFIVVKPKAVEGSPPRVRGTVIILIICSGAPRITPARAGNRIFAIFLVFLAWDHPRACGEQRGVERPQIIEGGSPPRVRGTGRPPKK